MEASGFAVIGCVKLYDTGGSLPKSIGNATFEFLCVTVKLCNVGSGVHFA